LSSWSSLSSFSFFGDEKRAIDPKQCHEQPPQRIRLRIIRVETLNKTRSEIKMSNKSKNAKQIVKGKIKQATGEALGNDQLAADGRDDQMEGNLKQAGEKVKDAFKE
jgi:uncharacterized protein YjbJ (UPF0337 family)